MEGTHAERVVLTSFRLPNREFFRSDGADGVECARFGLRSVDDVSHHHHHHHHYVVPISIAAPNSTEIGCVVYINPFPSLEIWLLLHASPYPPFKSQRGNDRCTLSL
jgi:hypothetical protein